MVEHLNAAARSETVRDWMSSANLSRPIRNLVRDLSDAVLVAELIAHFLPRYVILSNFAHVNSMALKRYNWETLQKTVFRYFNLKLTEEQIQTLAGGTDEALLEHVLLELKVRMDDAIRNGRFRPSSRRSRSSAVSSHGGSTLSLNKIDSYVSNGYRMNENGHDTMPARDIDVNCVYITSESQSNPQSSALQNFTQAQLVEKLYMRIRQLERNAMQKDEKISQLTQRLEKLTDIVCRREDAEMSISELNSPTLSGLCPVHFCPLVSGGPRCTTGDFRQIHNRDSTEILGGLNASDFQPSRTK